MSRTHASQDVYSNDTLAYSNAIVIEQPEVHKVRVKARVQGRPGAWELVIELTDASDVVLSKGDTGAIRTWTGLVDGEPFTLAAVQRKKDCGCR